MVGPMREKRAWPPQDKEDRAESIAFEETVAVVKETVARSGQVLSSAKEDLSDHQRWLEDQAAAVKADRARHDRWLQRQRERQEALERREQARLRRRQMRQRVAQAIKGAVLAVALSVSSAFWLVVGKTIAGLNYIDALAASGVKWVGRQLRDGALYVTRLLSRGGAWAGRKTGEIGRASGRALSAGFSFVAARAAASAQATRRVLSACYSFVAAKTSALARSTGRALSAGSSFAATKTSVLAGSTGRALSAGSSFAATKTSVLARSIASALSTGFSFAAATTASLSRSTGRVLSAGVSWISAKVHEVTPSIGRFLSVCFSVISARAQDLSRSTARMFAAGSAVIGPKVDAFARSTGAALAPAFAWTRAKAYAVAPSLAERIGRAGVSFRNFARERAGHVNALVATAKARRTRAPLPEGALAASPQMETPSAAGPLAVGEKALSSPRHIGEFDLSQMLIIAGTLLLVLGGLMLGGGLILRAGTPSQVAASSSESIVWFFEQKDLPIAERSIFIFSGTPEGVRIKGFSISAENRSDQPLTGVAGVVKPDVEGPDITLSVSIDMPTGEASLAHPPEANPADPHIGGVVPPHSPFKLVFPFPEEAGSDQDGVTAEEVVQTFGGLMLKVHYEVAGKEKAFMQYLSPAMLKDQLAEIEAEAKGS
jgi:hypothetical protein